MDWAKAKNIILVLLLILNLFLFINILNIEETFAYSHEYRNKAKQALEQNGLTITCNIPTNNNPIPRISFVKKDKNVNMYAGIIDKLTGVSEVVLRDEYYSNNGKTLIFSDKRFLFSDETGGITLPVDNEKRLDRILKAWIKENEVSKENFVLDDIRTQDNRVIVTYHQLYKRKPVFNNEIIFTIENEKLVSVEGSLRIFYDIKESKKEEVVSVEIVLLTGKDKITDSITSIELGYFLAHEDDLYDTMVWRIQLSTGEQVMFNAYTGEWIDPNSSI